MRYRHSSNPGTYICTVTCLVLLMFSAFVALPAWSQVSGTSANTPKQVQTGEAALVGPYNPSSMLRLAISIKAPKMAEEEQFLKELQDRNSPNFHKYLTPAQWNARFAPSAEDEQVVVDWATSKGLTITARYPNRLMVNVEGTVDTIQKSFNIKINHYQVNGQTEFSNDRDPEIPENLQGIVQYVDGLNSIVRLRPANSAMKGVRGPDYAPGPMHQIGESVHVNADSAAAQAIKTSGGQIGSQITKGFYDPTDFWSQQGYNYNALQAQGHCCNPLNNAGQTPPETTIGLATDGDFADSDMVGFHNQYPYLAYHYNRVFVDGTPAGGDDETTLDLEWTTATSNSQGSYVDTSFVWVYEAAQGFGDFGTLFQQMVNDNNVRVVNISYGLSETIFLDDAPSLLNSWHSIFNQMIGQGWTIMAASGDGGSDAGCTGSLAVLYPESDPDVTSVGGTELFLNLDGSFNTEVAWTGGTSPGSCSANNGGGGGGCSAVWSAPGYQVNPYCGSGSRSVPDISLNAGVGTNFFFNGSLSGVGGTSLASPLMSGFIAQENAYSLSMGNACDGTHNCAPIGQVDYDIYAEGGYNMSAPHYPFYDITSGCTTNDTIAVGWCAASGYDLATGWGSFNALQMAWAINWEDNLAYAAPSVAYSGPATNTWYNTNQTVSWSINANSNPTGIAGFTQGWDSIPSDPSSDTNRNHSNSFFSGPQFPNATTGCLAFAGGSCSGGVSQGCHTAHVRAWSNQGSTSGDVTYGPVCYDTIPPVTTATFSGTPISGTTYKSAVTVTLSASDAGSGVAATYYALNNGGYKAYTGPFAEGYTGNYTVHFYSVDKAGNTATASSASFTINPVLSLSPANLAFGFEVLGTTSAGKTATITNISSSAVSISSIVSSGDFVISSNTCGASLAGGASCAVTVTFKPSVLGGLFGDLTVNYSGIGSPDRLSLTGNGQIPLVASPGSLVFGSVAVGTTSAAQILTVKNNNPSTALTIGFSAGGDYKVTSGGGTPCGTSIAGGASCTLSVTFSPHQNGGIQGSVTVADGVALTPLVIPASGNGTGGASTPLSFSPASLDYGNSVEGTAYTKTVTVKNTSASPVKISNVTTSGDYHASGCTTTLASLATCTLTVGFTPTSLGRINGGVFLANSTTITPEILNVTGSGVLPLSVSPGSVNFGNVTVGATSGATTVTLTNQSTAALTIGFTASGDFSAAAGGGTPCGVSLAAGASCTLAVTFSPTTTGAVTGVVTVTDNAKFSPVEVNLSGTGQ